MKVKEAYKFSDVLMVPVLSCIDSRDTPSLETVFNDNYYALPFIASPMKGIVGVKLIKAIAELGGIGFLHKFWKYEHSFDLALEKLDGIRFGISLGINLTRLRQAESAEMILLDMANGYLDKVARAIAIIKKTYPNKTIVAGNVVTKQGAETLTSAGADLVRCGVGNGNLCITRDVTGVGYPQLSAISECSEVANVIADGGMSSSGDMAKALAAGALFCMLGSPLATAYESTNTGIIYGMASRRLHLEIGKEVKSIEGREMEVERAVMLKELLKQYEYGIRSSMTYMNAASLTELRQNVTWVKA